MRTIHPDTLHRWVMDLFAAAGSSPNEARLTADHLVLSNLSGHDSHGVGMVPRYVKAIAAGELTLNTDVEVVTDAGGILVIDAHRGIGQSVTHQAMKLAIARAHESGVCVMGLRNSHHLGRVGHWAEQAVAEGLIAVHFTNAVSQHWVAPYGGAEARFVTNPFTVGIPRADADGGPIVLDFATSAIAQGKVRVAYNAKKHTPEGALIDHEGFPTTNPGVLFEPVNGRTGALTTMAAHKGYALAMVCELLGAALTGGAVTIPRNQPKAGVWNNMLTIVFDPARFGTASAFDVSMRDFVAWVKSARLAEGFDEILMPGDPERRSRAARASAVPIDEGTITEMDQAAANVAATRGKGPGPLSVLMAGTA
ncbi:MAG: malate/lactate/ureidoglycolate dehydrogenase [Burkholderiales bacterium]|nr:malate/lactate/ureidoglycolate dehydrogenase [Burkholderiales bacterium]